MAQAKKQLEINDFSGGFNTEQNPLRADPATTIEEQNMVLASDGTRARRYGLKEEQANPLLILPLASQVANPVPAEPATHSFNNIGLDPLSGDVTLLDFSVIFGSSSFNSYSHVFRENSPGFVNKDNTTSTFEMGGSYLSSTGGLKGEQFGSEILLPEGSRVRTIFPSSSGATIQQFSSELFIRDFWGVDDSLKVDERPSTLDERHAYNLLNQGWEPQSIYKFFTEIGDYPSNADIPYYGLLPDNSTPINVAYDPEILKSVPAKNGAPKGRFLLGSNNPLYSVAVGDKFTELTLLTGIPLDVSKIGDSTGAPQVATNWNVQTISSFMGRAFYTGEILGNDPYSANSSSESKFPSMKNFLLFSGVLEDTAASVGFFDTEDANAGVSSSNAYYCASRKSPTDELFTPTAADGGFLIITDAERLLGTVVVGDSIIVIATNGMWELRAQDGFSPSTFILSRLSNSRINTFKSVVRITNGAIVAAEDGLLVLYYDGNSRRTIVKNITTERIRSFYTKHFDWFGWGAYDESSDSVSWLLHTPASQHTAGTVVEVEQKELVLDLALGAFSVNVYPSATVGVSDRVYTVLSGAGLSYKVPNYYATTATMQASNFIGNYIQLKTAYAIGKETTPIDYKRNRIKLKKVVVDTLGIGRHAIYDHSATDFLDFGTTDVPAFMVTNPMTLGDTVHQKDFQKVWTHFYRTEDGFEDDGTGDWIPTNQSGCLMSARFDFSDSATSGKWTAPRQVYRLERQYLPEDINDSFDYGHYLITTKNDVPGQGLSLSLKFESEVGKDMQLVGWGTLVRVNEGY